jgi:hypothetical protein
LSRARHADLPLTTDDTKEKDALGQLWAAKSDGKCLFLLVSDTDCDARIRQAVQ